MIGPLALIVVAVKTMSEANLREHWAVKAKRHAAQRDAVAASVWPLLAEQCKAQLDAGHRLVVTLCRIAPGLLDDDNLGGALKAIRDEVAVQIGLPCTKRGKSRRKRDIADDRDVRVSWRYEQDRGARGEYGVEIRIESI